MECKAQAKQKHRSNLIGCEDFPRAATKQSASSALISDVFAVLEAVPAASSVPPQAFAATST